MPHTLHRQVQQESERLGMNLNDWVIWALKNSMRSSKRRVTPREQELEAS
jgi:predicted HicB family RNase H-like nuclease